MGKKKSRAKFENGIAPELILITPQNRPYCLKAMKESLSMYKKGTSSGERVAESQTGDVKFPTSTVAAWKSIIVEVPATVMSIKIHRISNY